MPSANVFPIYEIVPRPRPRRAWLSPQEEPPSAADFHPSRPAVKPTEPEPINPYPGRLSRRPFPAWISRQAPVAPPGPAGLPGPTYPLVERHPDPKVDPDRLRRITEKLAAVMNSLAGDGFLRLDGVSHWTLLPGGFYQNHPPGANDDVTAGAYPFHVWIDTSTNTVYMNVVNTQGAAVWVKISP